MSVLETSALPCLLLYYSHQLRVRNSLTDPSTHEQIKKDELCVHLCMPFCVYSGILLSLENEQNPDICDMNEPESH